MDKELLQKVISVIMDVLASEMKWDAKMKRLEELDMKDDILVALKEQLKSGPAGQIAAFSMLVALF